MEHRTENGAHHLFLDHLVKQCDQSIVVAVRVEDDDGFGVQPELFVNHALKKLIHRADSSGQCNIRVANALDGLFTLGHVSRNNQFRALFVMPVLFNHELRNDPDKLSVVFHHGIGHFTHETHVAPTEDHRNVVLSKNLAKLSCRGEEFGPYFCR